MTLTNYKSNKNADYEPSEMTVSNYNSNENANYEPSESENSYEQIHHDITSTIIFQ